MDTKRLFLYAALGLIVYSLWYSWQQDYPSAKSTVSKPAPNFISSEALTPSLAGTKSEAPLTPTLEEKATPTKTSIQVKTDVLDIRIDENTGDIVNAKLLQYPVTVDEPTNPVTLLYQEDNHQYIAASNLLVQEGNATKVLHPQFSSAQQAYLLNPGQKEVIVQLKGETEQGLHVIKEYTFTKGSYLVGVRYKIENKSTLPWDTYLNTQLIQSAPQEDSSSLFHVGSFTGASYSQPGVHKYQKVPFKQMRKNNMEVEVEGGWVAMQQHYFLSAWVPSVQTSKNKLYTRAANDTYTIGSLSSPVKLAPNESGILSSQLYLGPEEGSVLKNIAPGLDLTIDYGWLWFLSSALFTVMAYIYSVVGNWGWAIVLVTVLIKLLFYRLSASSYKSMAGMRQLQPKLQALKERYGDDKAKISQATMELYRNEKVNPLGGCLPIVIQIPVFIALYWVLLESVALRQAPFIFWIRDLASPDPFHVLPILMGITMLVQQRLNPAPPDPMQAKLMMLLPIFFTAIFWNFPAGLVLYWIVNNTLSILQQWYITNKYESKVNTKVPALSKK